MGEQFPDDEEEFQNALRNGEVICRLANIIRPGSVRKVSLRFVVESQINHGAVFLERENVSAFISFARSIGCPEMDLFCVNDLYELKNFKKVCMCILSVGRYSASVDGFEGPYFIGGKMTYNRQGEVERVVLDTTSENPICPTCHKPVMFTERFTALGEVYHKLCFKCLNCGNIIGGGDYCDHNNKPLCPKCYEQLYGTRPNKAEYSAKGSYRVEENERKAPVLSKNAEAMRDLFKPTVVKCATCGKTVYPAEMVTFHGERRCTPPRWSRSTDRPTTNCASCACSADTPSRRENSSRGTISPTARPAIRSCRRLSWRRPRISRWM